MHRRDGKENDGFSALPCHLVIMYIFREGDEPPAGIILLCILRNKKSICSVDTVKHLI